MRPAIVIATCNQGKISELAVLLKNFKIEVKSLADFGPIPEVVEDGDTFEANAYKKASQTARILGLPAMADDSGLCVDALNGAPGVFSARYFGAGISDTHRCQRLLQQMEDKTDRKAVFECVISIAMPGGAALTYQASCQGLIADKISGTNGFGYDPIFYYPPLDKTFAQLSQVEKNRISHRGKALAEVNQEFDKIIQWIEIHERNYNDSGFNPKK